ncbi:hypothetical protein BSCH_01906 [Candidatus Paraburkholderia schumanniana]|nr:hypothetical protein BSCH_01906 [Candidatus Paraburkholderia schumannianae]
MDALYLYLEVVAPATLAWLCRDKFKALFAKPLASCEEPVVKSRPRRVRAPRRSRRLHRHRSSLAQ